MIERKTFLVTLKYLIICYLSRTANHETDWLDRSIYYIYMITVVSVYDKNVTFLFKIFYARDKPSGN